GIICQTFIHVFSLISSCACNNPPPKPWERVGTSSGPAPFKPPSGGSTSDVVEASGTAKPGEVVSAAQSNAAFNVNNTVAGPVPPRPWQQQGYGNTYGGDGASTYNSYGGFGGAYSNGGLYGNNNMYSGYGGGYGGSYGGSGMYGGSMYNNGMGNPYGGMGMSPYNQGPHSFGPPAPPPGFWVSFLRVMHGIVNFSGRVAFLISQNTQAFHMFITALLQLCDKSGMLYGELARFTFRLLGIKTKPNKGRIQGAQAPSLDGPGQQFVEAPKASKNSWENVWSGDAKGM
uniref:Peroxin-13 n=1 Tax=Aegilops tauschii subsp. strangulata TaxID=200361 RepID=A0A453M017_AEGTS